MKGAWKK